MFQQNALLTYTTDSDQPTGFDPVTGAPIFGKTKTEVKASLEEVSRPKQDTLPGVDETSIYLEGRASKPRYLPSEFKTRRFIDLTLDKGEQGHMKGKFYLLPKNRSRLGLESYFGDAIAGFLQVEEEQSENN